MFEYILP
jgi:hypothetical protein